MARLNLFNDAGFVLGGILTGLVGSQSLRWGFLVPLVGVLLIIPLAPAFARPRRELAVPAGRMSSWPCHPRSPPPGSRSSPPASPGAARTCATTHPSPGNSWPPCRARRHPTCKRRLPLRGAPSGPGQRSPRRIARPSCSACTTSCWRTPAAPRPGPGRDGQGPRARLRRGRRRGELLPLLRAHRPAAAGTPPADRGAPGADPGGRVPLAGRAGRADHALELPADARRRGRPARAGRRQRRAAQARHPDSADRAGRAGAGDPGRAPGRPVADRRRRRPGRRPAADRRRRSHQLHRFHPRPAGPSPAGPGSG